MLRTKQSANKHIGKPFPYNMTGCSWRLYRKYGNHRNDPIVSVNIKKRRIKIHDTDSEDGICEIIQPPGGIVTASNSTIASAIEAVEIAQQRQLLPNDRSVPVKFKKRRIKIHDTDSEVDKCEIIQPSGAILTASNSTIASAIEAVEIAQRPQLLPDDRSAHPTNCACTRCAANCKYLNLKAEHMGSDTSGTTGSSESDYADSFVSSEEDIYTAAEAEQLKIMFPISAHRITTKIQRSVRNQL
jgi:hypothetical protein